MISIITLVLISFSLIAYAEDYNLVSGEATYTVKHTLKKVQGTSKEVKGKIQCKEQLCQFLLAIKVDTFLSSDSNRDLNMQTTLESSKYPVAVAKGEFNLKEWNQAKLVISAEVDFHGIKKQYTMTLINDVSGMQKTDLVLDLEAHKIERPSLFTMKIENTVPVHFKLQWKKVD